MRKSGDLLIAFHKKKERKKKKTQKGSEILMIS